MQDVWTEIVRYQGRWRVFAFNSKACAILNQRLKNYPETVDFEAEGSEGVFNFLDADLAFVKAVIERYP